MPRGRMDIEIGSRVIIEFAGKERMNCQFIGLDEDQFVVLKVPMTPGIRERMAAGQVFQFRYLEDGKIIGFVAETLRYQASPASLLFISYPTTFSAYNLRSEGRVECHFPTQLTIGKDIFPGNIVDMNSHGCRFVFEKGLEPTVAKEAPVSGTYTTMESGKEYSFKGMVTVQQSLVGEKSLGIRFEGEAELPGGIRASLSQTFEDEEKTV